MAEHDSTRRLVAEILNGNSEKFRDIIEAYKRLVYHVVSRMIPAGVDREDLCQDVFLKVYRNLGRFKFDSKLSTWIGRIAFNTCVNFLEKRRDVPYDDYIGAEDRSIEDEPAITRNPAASFESRSLSERVRVEVGNLPPQYGLILALYHFEEMSYVDIGQVLNSPVGTVKSHLFRARKMLKERLLKKYAVEDLCL